jgi:hypothetical protein
MTVKLTNRSHRIAHTVVIFILAVALSTVLVLAGDWDSDKQLKKVFPQESGSAPMARVDQGASL